MNRLGAMDSPPSVALFLRLFRLAFSAVQSQKHGQIVSVLHFNLDFCKISAKLPLIMFKMGIHARERGGESLFFPLQIFPPLFGKSEIYGHGGFFLPQNFEKNFAEIL